jgi:AraC family transcriptional regulator, exoenzyme S synthesis regulatory protein ExsA
LDSDEGWHSTRGAQRHAQQVLLRSDKSYARLEPDAQCTLQTVLIRIILEERIISEARPDQSMTPFLNAFDVIRAIPTAKRFEIGEMLFAQFECPVQDEPLKIWSQTDHLVHVVSARSTWKTSMGMCSAEAGESVFFRKGAHISPPHLERDLCLLIFFIPDAFVREVIRELAAELHPLAQWSTSDEVVIRLNNDTALSAFFHSMLVYFAGKEQPAEALLKLKLKELLTSLLVSPSNTRLSAYLRSLATCDAPPLPAIMEANFCHSLPLDAFAKMCHRSLSSFKREFHRCYRTTPARWLIERRLECAAQMLRTTSLSVIEIALECGFEEPSHFSRTFKSRFGRSPTDYREKESTSQPLLS